jgi:hypothetical protein
MKSSQAALSKTQMSWRKKVLFLMVPLVPFFLGMELLFRAMGFGSLPDIPRQVGPNAYWWIADQELGFRNRENGRYQYSAMEGSPISTTDERGYRNGLGWERRFTIPPEVVLVGDSLIFGAELNDDQTINSRLYTILNGKTPVVNAGVRGYNGVQIKRMLRRVLSQFDRIRVVLYVYADNDLMGNLVLLTAPVKAPLLQLAGSRDSLIEVEVDRQAVAWGESFELISKPAPYSWKENLVRRTLIVSHSAALNQLVRRSAALFEAGIERAPGGNQYREDIGIRGLLQILRDMKEMCERRNVRLLAARATASNAKDSPMEERFLTNCVKAGVEAIPVARSFPGNPHQYMSAIRNYNEYDFHYGPRGAARFAEVVAPRIRSKLR